MIGLLARLVKLPIHAGDSDTQLHCPFDQMPLGSGRRTANVRSQFRSHLAHQAGFFGAAIEFRQGGGTTVWV
jgi:hypothetical protein